MTLAILSHGVDSLYLSFHGTVHPQLLVALDELKAAAQEGGEPVPIFLQAGRATTVQASGWGHYRYWLHARDFDLFVAKGEKLPPGYVRISSECLHALGAERAAREAEAVVRLSLVAGNESPEVSRMDLYADFQGWVPSDSDYQRFVTRSTRNATHREHARGYFDRRVFTGFQFGRGELVARLYDKTREVTGSEKELWLRQLWRNGFNPDQPVWRLEFQFRRPVLRDFNLYGVDEVLASREDLWQYGLRWLSLRDASANKQRARWPVAQEWRDFSTVTMSTAIQGVVRRRVSERSDLVLIRGLAGYLTSLAAARGLRDLEPVLRLTGRLVPKYLSERDKEFRKIAYAKRERLLLDDLPSRVPELATAASEAAL